MGSEMCIRDSIKAVDGLESLIFLGQTLSFDNIFCAHNSIVARRAYAAHRREARFWESYWGIRS